MKQARQLYDKALAANGNNPLIMAGKGHVLLLDKKKDEARQMFESAVTISATKKGNDPNILNAVGRANVDAKEGNLDYAVQVLEQALQLNPKNADIALNLGNAYRKKDPDKAVAERMKNIYWLRRSIQTLRTLMYVLLNCSETQGQWDLVLENLNKAVQVDPNFSLAYYELFLLLFL
jgi:tetratricopeptide (TPR) repeat protein